jgi:hypothetical protein
MLKTFNATVALRPGGLMQDMNIFLKVVAILITCHCGSIRQCGKSHVFFLWEAIYFGPSEYKTLKTNQHQTFNG